MKVSETEEGREGNIFIFFVLKCSLKVLVFIILHEAIHLKIFS